MGKLIKWTFAKLIEAVEQRVQNQYDAIIFVDGERGCGKSTFIWKFGTRLNTRGVVKFNPETDIVYSREDTIQMLATHKQHFIFSDEMINVAYNRDFYEKDQKVLLKALNMYRDSCNVFIGAIPKFGDLDTQIRRLCRIRITIIRRGVALIHIPTRNLFTPDPWQTQENIKREQKFKANSKSYGKLTTVKGILRFSDMLPGQREQYEKIKHEKRGHVFETAMQELKTPMDKVYDQLFKDLTNFHITKQDVILLSRTLGRDYDTLRGAMSKRIRADPDITQPLPYYFKEASRKKEELKQNKKGSTTRRRAVAPQIDGDTVGGVRPQHNTKNLSAKQKQIWEEI